MHLQHAHLLVRFALICWPSFCGYQIGCQMYLHAYMCRFPKEVSLDWSERASAEEVFVKFLATKTINVDLNWDRQTFDETLEHVEFVSALSSSFSLVCFNLLTLFFWAPIWSSDAPSCIPSFLVLLLWGDEFRLTWKGIGWGGLCTVVAAIADGFNDGWQVSLCPFFQWIIWHLAELHAYAGCLSNLCLSSHLRNYMSINITKLN